jgi:outer membrane protein assembly factor BamB
MIASIHDTLWVILGRGQAVVRDVLPVNILEKRIAKNMCTVILYNKWLYSVLFFILLLNTGTILLGGDVLFNSTGLVSEGLSVVFSTPIEIIQSSDVFSRHEQNGKSTEWVFGDGEVQPFGGFGISWEPQSASIVDYTWRVKGMLKWQYDTTHQVFSPTVDYDGTVYFANYLTLCALSPDGSLKWEYMPDQDWGPMAPEFVKGVVYTPSVGLHGSIYFGAYKYFYALSTGGDFRWQHVGLDDMAFCPAAIAVDETIYVTMEQPSDILAFNPDGSMKWLCEITNYRAEPAFYGSPVIGIDGTVYAAGCQNGVLYAISAAGILKWQCMIGTEETRIYGSPGIGVDGTIYVGATNGSLYAVSPEGRIRWEYKTDGQLLDSVAIDRTGTIYFGSWDGCLYALNPDGTLKWCYKTGSPVQSTPAIDIDGTVYVGSNDHYLYAMYPDGTLKWRFKTNAAVQSSPAIVKDTIYFSAGNTLYALRTFSNGIMQSVWPMYGHDPQHSGRVR